MMTVVSALLYTLAVLTAILLICLVLVQPAKGGGFGSAFGGVGEGVFGAQTMGHLSKLTVYLITFFFIVTLLLASVAGHRGNQSVKASSSAAMQMTEEKPAAKAPATETAKPAAKAPATETAKPAAKAPATETAKPAAKAPATETKAK